MLREIAAVLRDPGTQWMVFLCLGIYFIVFVFLRARSSHGLFSTIRITGRARQSVRGSSTTVSAADSGTVSVRESETGGGTPPEPAGEDACATVPVVGTARCAVRSSQRDDPTGWLSAGVFISAVVYAFNYSPSTQALTLLAGAVIGQAFGLWGGLIAPSPVGDEVTSLKLKSKFSQRLLTSSPTIIVVLLAIASLWKPDSFHTFEYRDQARWSGPWDNPNLFGLLMGTGVVLAAGLGLRGWKMENGRSNHCSSRRKKALTSEVESGSAPAPGAAGDALVADIGEPKRENKFDARAHQMTAGAAVVPQRLTGAFRIVRYVSAFFCLVAVVLLGRGLFHSYSRGAWAATGCGLGYLMWQVIKCPGSGVSNSEFGIRNSEFPRVSWLRKNWLPFSVILSSILLLSFWHFRETEWHPARRAFSAVNAVDFSWRNRVAAWEGALQITAEHPWLGAGWNKPESLYQNYYLPPKLQESAAIQMNDYLLLGSTLGIPALFCFGMYIWLAVRGVSSFKFQVPNWGARPPQASFCAPSRKTSPEAGEVGCEAHPTTPGAGVLPATCRAAAIVLLIGFWFDGGLFKLATASTFWILLESGWQDSTMDKLE